MVMKKGPLTEDDLRVLNKLLTACRETDEYLSKCEKCNLDVARERQQNAEQAETAAKLKALFFPNAR